ncbi:hypothetical protein, variant [Puccinia triticina 1-1 BBBD Race 1]|uniref:Phosphatidylglycerol/phosphatidylinositol transfer protein n=2 Tax=Puccinia triticina TaxID=208348 RepID=A0A180G3A5_PUCT1|nr:uncharacterized protein PtA15_14A342 [Puccinia triticina]OAV87140.1 hypothetical protein PTTG_09239 [Puccinia triticina 1-1 BBBD Race 1]OAV87141.1 hypothetical protein, variant [Puccinia triticina 1-1 BBBD Race 1]WAQ91458.1 hypothetical protein PtA15_14A342 [Puccinia triticina]WAR62265.1 hypothetical protein PtB15_14B360 [Puccinia triticina]
MPSIPAMFGLLAVLVSVLHLAHAKPVLPPFVAHSYVRLANRDQPASGASSDDNQVAFAVCPAAGYEIHGEVNAMTITPCQRAAPTDPCTFIRGRNYTIELEFLSYLDAENPRSSIVAGDPKEGPYAYSGQSFAACKYTNCPIHANVASTYVYHFQTLASDFNYLTFNVTNDFFGPSLFCAGTPINFQQQP